MNKETLYDLRSLLALYPYHQTARLLMLQNLYIMHDTSFDEELKRAAIFLSDRRVIFNLVESAYYKIKNIEKKAEKPQTKEEKEQRTLSLIDNFLENRPAEVDEEDNTKRKPTAADAAIDYVAYLLEMENADENDAGKAPEMKGQSLIDNFINKENGKIELNETPEFTPEIDEDESDKDEDEGFFTETLARIYIKQGNYLKALEIIQRLNLNYPKKNAYFADQIRFLEKLIINSKK